MATNDLTTGIKITGDASDFIHELDKMVQRLDITYRKIDDHLGDISKVQDQMTTAQKRLVAGIQSEYSKLAKTYDEIRSKYEAMISAIQRSGGQATAEQTAKLAELRNTMKTLRSEMNGLERESYTIARSLGAIGKSANDSSKDMQSMSQDMRSLVSLQAAGMFKDIASSVVGFGTNCVMAKESLTQLRKGLEQVTGSVQSGKDAYDAFMSVANETPFNIQGVIGIGKSLLMQGMSVDEATQSIVRYGDAAAALGVDISRVSNAMSQLKGSATISAFSMNELQWAGINAYKILGEKFNMSANEFRAQMHKMGISGVEAWEVINEALKQYKGSMDTLDKSLTGSIDALGETWQNQFLPTIGDAIEETFDITGNFRKLRVELDNLYAEFKEGVDTTQSLQGALEHTFGQPIVLAVEALASALGVTLMLATAGAAGQIYKLVAANATAGAEIIKVAALNLKEAITWTTKTVAVNAYTLAMKRAVVTAGTFTPPIDKINALAVSMPAVLAGLTAFIALMYQATQNGQELAVKITDLTLKHATYAETLDKVSTSQIGTTSETEELARAISDADTTAADNITTLNELDDKLQRLLEDIDTTKEAQDECNGVSQQVLEITGDLRDTTEQYNTQLDDLIGYLDPSKKETQELRQSQIELNNAFDQGSIQVTDYAKRLSALFDLAKRQTAGTKGAEIADLKLQGYSTVDYGDEYDKLSSDTRSAFFAAVDAYGPKSPTTSSQSTGKSATAPKDNRENETSKKIKNETDALKKKFDLENKLFDLEKANDDIRRQYTDVDASEDEKVLQTYQDKLTAIEDQMEAEQRRYDQSSEINQQELEAWQQALEEGVPGSQKHIDMLNETMQTDATLHEARIAQLQERLEFQKELNKIDKDQYDTSKVTAVTAAWKQYAQTMRSSVSTALQDIINGTKGVGDALKGMATSLIQNAISMLAEWVSLCAVLMAFGCPNPGQVATKMMFGVSDTSTWSSSAKSWSGIGSAEGHARGGYISGPGTGTSDSIPAMLSNGEYVLRASVVNAIGKDTLDALNSGAIALPNVIMHKAEGGIVGTEIKAVSQMSPRSDTTSMQPIFNISALDSKQFQRFLETGGADKLARVLQNRTRRFETQKGTW